MRQWATHSKAWLRSKAKTFDAFHKLLKEEAQSTDLYVKTIKTESQETARLLMPNVFHYRIQLPQCNTGYMYS